MGARTPVLGAISVVTVLLFGLLPTAALGAMWTSTPKGKWECRSSGNTCVAHTGFKPADTRWWGQATNRVGNCTNYAAYRLIKNDAKDPGFNGSGGAVNWRNVVRSRLGKDRANGKPAVGSIAWWSYGHVAYVEKVVNGAVYLSDSSWPTRPGIGGSSRKILTPGGSGWPDAFLHVKDQPAPASKPKPKPKPPPKSSGPAPAGKGDSTGYYEPGPHGWHLSNALAPGSSNYIFARGSDGSIPVVGDWNGDGKDSTGFYEPGPRGWHLRDELNPGSSEYIFARGEPNSIPLVGDWDGDGRDSTGAYFPWDSSFHLRNELNPGPSEYIFARGEPNSIPVVGDWDGDGKDSTGVYYPWDQSWHLRNELSAGSSEYIFQRGQPNSIPLVGDWDGDGKDSTGVFFPWDNSFHLRNELNPGPSEYAFVRASTGSTPVIGNWDGL
jgi:surface antigen